MDAQHIILNLTPGGAPEVVHVSQLDHVANGLEVEIYKDDVKLSLSGMSATIEGMKSDEKIFQYSHTSISSDKVVFNITQQMTAAAGDAICEVRLTDSSGNDAGTANFILAVEKSPIEGGVSSASDLPAVFQNIEDAREAASSAKASASAASSSATKAASSASSASGSASSASTSASNASKSATAASSSASAAAASQKAAANSATSASDSASAAKGSASAAKTSEGNAAASQKAAAGSETAAATSAQQASDYKDQAAGYSGAASYSFVVDSEGYMCLNYKEETS